MKQWKILPDFSISHLFLLSMLDWIINPLVGIELTQKFGSQSNADNIESVLWLIIQPCLAIELYSPNTFKFEYMVKYMVNTEKSDGIFVICNSSRVYFYTTYFLI